MSHSSLLFNTLYRYTRVEDLQSARFLLGLVKDWGGMWMGHVHPYFKTTKQRVFKFSTSPSINIHLNQYRSFPLPLYTTLPQHLPILPSVLPFNCWNFWTLFVFILVYRCFMPVKSKVDNSSLFHLFNYYNCFINTDDSNKKTKHLKSNNINTDHSFFL